MMRFFKRAFTLVETMIAVALNGFLATLAIPTFLKVRANVWISKCQTSQGQLRDAISLYSLASGRRDEDPITIAEKPDILKGLKPGLIPHCPIHNTPLNWPKTFGDKVRCPVDGSKHDLK